jgi:hypothetical protein
MTSCEALRNFKWWVEFFPECLWRLRCFFFEWWLLILRDGLWALVSLLLANLCDSKLVASDFNPVHDIVLQTLRLSLKTKWSQVSSGSLTDTESGIEDSPLTFTSRVCSISRTVTLSDFVLRALTYITQAANNRPGIQDSRAGTQSKAKEGIPDRNQITLFQKPYYWGATQRKCGMRWSIGP